VRKKRGKYVEKARENISLSFPVPVHDFRLCNFRSLPVTSFPVMQLPVTIPHIYDLDGAYILLSSL
jgi:hypothetical protein